MEFGIYTRSNGDRYEGPFKEGKENGMGVFVWAEGARQGDRYEGFFKDGLMHGEGIYTCAIGVSFQGVWRGGMLTKKLYQFQTKAERKRKRKETQ